MSKAYFVLPLLLGTPLIQSCTSLPLTLASTAVKAAMPAQGAEESAVAYYQVGRYHEARGELEYAAAAYERARKIDPSFYEATNALGVLHARQGKTQLAIAELQSAVQQAPAAGHIYNNLGYAYYLHARYPEAIDAFRKAAELNPHNARPQRNLALVYDKTGQPDKAAAAANAAALAQGPAPGANYGAAAARQPTRAPQAAVAVTAPAAPIVTMQRDGALVPAARPRDVTATATTTNAPPRSGIPATVGGLVAIAPNIYELRAPAALAAVPVQDVTSRVLREPPVVHETPASRVTIKSFRLEVSNGNGTTGMAQRVAGSLKAAGLQPVRLTNQIPWQRVSEIQFSEGYAAEAAHLAGMLGQELLTIRNDHLRRDIKVRLVLGKDIKRETAFVAPGQRHQVTTVASAR